jgi:hypothetical protein
MAFASEKLIVTGHFSEAGGQPASNIAAWNGGNWSPLGSGLNNVGEGLSVRGSDIFVVGAFSRAGGKPSIKLAGWHDPQ